MYRILLFLALLPAAATAQTDTDWANYTRYAAANASLTENPLVVFMGDSLTDGWDDADPGFFTDGRYVCRGISGQVTAQMLSRFRADVLNLEPLAVLILAGSNDVARNNGFVAPEHIVGNIASMAELAEAHGIRPILCSVLPAGQFPWRPDITEVADKLRDLNARLRLYAAEKGYKWVDYYDALAAPDGSMRLEYTADGVHPNAAGYAVMEQIVAPVLAEWE